MEMLFGDKQLYRQTRSLKRGEARLAPCLEVLRSKIAEKFGIKILNIVYDKIEIGPAKGRPRLNVIVDSEEDRSLIEDHLCTVRSDVKEVILKDFSEIVEKMGLQDEFATKNAHLISDVFSAEAMHQAVSAFFKKDSKAAIKSFPANEVWRIDGFGSWIVVFFRTESAKASALSSGLATEICKRCFEAVKRYDEFNYINAQNFNLTFDSKENLDKNFEGNLYYYFK